MRQSNPEEILKESDLPTHNEFSRALMSKVAKGQRLGHKNPPECEKERWLTFIKKMRWDRVVDMKTGAFFYRIDKKTRDLVLETYANYLIYEIRSKPSTIESRYSACLKFSKQKGIPVRGSKEARDVVGTHKKKHVKKKGVQISEKALGAFLAELSDETFGPPGHRLKVAQIDLERLNYYFLYLATILTVLREASILPEGVKSKYLHALVFGRDVVFRKNSIQITAFTKQGSQKGALTPQCVSAPKFGGDSEKLNFHKQFR